MTTSISQLRPATTQPTAPSGSETRFDRLIMAIGQPDFGRTVFEMRQEISNADRCVVFENAATAPACILDTGLSAKAPHGILLRHTQALPAMGEIQERQRLARLAGAVDIVAFTASAGRRAYTIFVLRERNGTFTADELSALGAGSEIIGACIIKNRQAPQDSFDRGGVISRVILHSGAFECLTNREKSVCVGILTGHTTEAIALHLGISPNSVLTFRRRTYQKLGISSQNELFMRVVETAKSL